MSARQPSSALLMIFAVVLLTGLALWMAPQDVAAQCSDPKPSCVTCHAETHPVVTQGEWHVIHARKECCRNCHGGNDQAQDKDLAHVDITLHPLENTYTSCHQCHPDDYRQRADRFAVVLRVTPTSSEPITRVAALQPPGSDQTVGLPIFTPPSSDADTAPWLWTIVGVVAALLAGLALMWRKLSQG